MKKNLVSEAEYQMYKDHGVEKLLEIKANRNVKSRFPIGNRKPRIVGIEGGINNEVLSHVSEVQMIKFRNDSKVDMVFYQFDPVFMTEGYVTDNSRVLPKERKFVLKPGEEAGFPVVIVSSVEDRGDYKPLSHTVVAAYQGNNWFAMDADERIIFAVKPKDEVSVRTISLSVGFGPPNPWGRPVTAAQEHLFRFVDDRELYDEHSRLNGMGHIQTSTQLEPPIFDEKPGRPISMYTLRNQSYSSYLAPEPEMSEYRENWFQGRAEDEADEAEDALKEAAKNKTTKQ